MPGETIAKRLYAFDSHDANRNPARKIGRAVPWRFARDDEEIAADDGARLPRSMLLGFDPSRDRFRVGLFDG